MHKTSKRRKTLAHMDVREKLYYYEGLLARHQQSVTRIHRKIAELSDSREWGCIRILEDPRTSQLGITLQRCTALLKPIFPHIRERGCLKVLEILIKQGLVRRRADESRHYILNSRCPEWADKDHSGRMFLTDEDACFHPELDITSQAGD